MEETKKERKERNHYIEVINKEREIIKMRDQIENWYLKGIIIKIKIHSRFLTTELSKQKKGSVNLKISHWDFPVSVEEKKKPWRKMKRA